MVTSLISSRCLFLFSEEEKRDTEKQTESAEVAWIWRGWVIYLRSILRLDSLQPVALEVPKNKAFDWHAVLVTHNSWGWKGPLEII